MSERRSDNWISLLLSVAIHGALIAVLLYGVHLFSSRAKPPVPTLAIEASLIDSRDLGGAKIPPMPNPPPLPAPEPEPEPAPVVEEAPPPEPEQPPQPSPEEVAEKERVEREQLEKIALEKRQEEERVAEEKRVAEQREAAERQKREEAAAAERKKQEEAEAKRKAEEKRKAEQKKLEDAKRLAEEKRKAEEARQRAAQEDDLRRNLEAEQRQMAARASGATQSWIAAIQGRIQRAWLRPPSARAGLDCTVLVTQVPGGEVTAVRVTSCNGDESVRASIEAAVYRASPLPPPPDPEMFERNLELHFRPVE